MIRSLTFISCAFPSILFLFINCDPYLRGDLPVDRETLNQFLLDGKDVSHVDTSEITDMSYLLNGAWWLGIVYVDIDFSNWDVSNVTDMEGMFIRAGFFDGDLSNWDVSNVTNMNYMFQYCSSFNSDISSWDVSNVIYMGGMFGSARAFNRDLSSWKDHISEDIYHEDFSAGTNSLPTHFHPYPSWDD